MNFYKHHIGDYDADTAHLTWLEDMAYTRLMRLYYRREAPIPSELSQACRLVRAVSKQEREAVESVLNEFFVLEDDGWHNKRCDMEIGEKQTKADKNREVGKLGGRPRKEKTEMVSENNHDGFFSEPKHNPSHKPIANKENPLLNPPADSDEHEAIAAGAAQAVSVAAIDSAKGKQTFVVWYEAMRARGGKPLTDYDGLWSYVERTGLSRDLILLAWVKFKDHYTDDEKGRRKRYTDWRAVFLRSVKEGWFKLWVIRDGEYVLTTIGQQAMREQEAA